MSLYASIRFRGIVKPEFRKIFEPIALRGEWETSDDPIFRDFGGNVLASQFSCRAKSCCFVPRWEREPWNRSYSVETGEWLFECDINQYTDSTILIEFEEEIVPYCMAEVSHYEHWSEPIDYVPSPHTTSLLQLIDGKLTCIGTISEDGQFLPCED